MDKSKIIVIKNSEYILISYQGKRLVVNNDLFDELKNLSKDEIKEWYINR